MASARYYPLDDVLEIMLFCRLSNSSRTTSDRFAGCVLCSWLLPFYAFCGFSMAKNTSNLPTGAEIMKAMSEVVLARDFKRACKRTLTALMKVDKSILETDANLRKIGALKKLGVTCITADVWFGVEVKAALEEEEFEQVFLVKKSVKPHLLEDPVLKSLVISPEECTGNIDHEQVWVLDYAAIEHIGKLGGRVRQHKMGIRVTHKLRATPPLAHAPHLGSSSVQIEEVVEEEDSGTVRLPRGGQRDGLPPAAAGDPLLQAKETTATRQLQPRVSDPLVADALAMTKIMERTEKLAAAGAWHDEDPMEADTVEFQVRTYRYHVQAKKEQANALGKPLSEIMEPEMRVFLKYCIQWLLEGDSFEAYKHIHKHFEAIAHDCEGTDLMPVPKTSQVIGKLSEARRVISGQDDLNLESLALAPATLQLVFNSKF